MAWNSRNPSGRRHHFQPIGTRRDVRSKRVLGGGASEIVDGRWWIVDGGQGGEEGDRENREWRRGGVEETTLLVATMLKAFFEGPLSMVDMLKTWSVILTAWAEVGDASFPATVTPIGFACLGDSALLSALPPLYRGHSYSSSIHQLL